MADRIGAAVRAKKADPFAVWGKPPPLLRTITKRQQNSLRRYISKVVEKCYRVAYDAGSSAKQKSG